MFDVVSALAGAGLGSVIAGDVFEPVTDYLSGYTSANAANRFAVENALLQQKLIQENMALQQEYNEKNMALQQGYNEKNMDLQHGYNIKNMRLTDSYQRAMMFDSPSLQVAALRRAGLNPLLAVSNGITSAGTAVHASTPSSSTPSSSNPSSSTPSVSSPSVNPLIGIGDIVSAASSAGNLINSSRLADAQIADYKASAALKMADALNKPSVKANIDADTRKKGVETITRGIDSATGAITGVTSAFGAKKVAQIMSKTATPVARGALSPLSKFGLLGLPAMMSAAGAAAALGTDKAASKLSPKGRSIHRAAQGNLMNILP